MSLLVNWRCPECKQLNSENINSHSVPKAIDKTECGYCHAMFTWLELKPEEGQ